MTAPGGHPWRAILPEPLAGRALDVVSRTAAALAVPEPPGVPPADVSLSQGTAGVAAFLAAAGAALDSPGLTDRAVALLDDAVDAVAAASTLDLRLFGATLGVAWAVSRVGAFLGEPDDGADDDIDLLVLRLVSREDWTAHYDLVTGLVGVGVYCLERLPRPAARAGLEVVVTHLARLAERGADGAVWPTTPAAYPPRADAFPDGHHDLGVAHGVAGVVAFLAAAARAGVPEAGPLLVDAARWLRARGGPEGGPDGRFPATLAPDGTAAPARMAWCYGDPGVAAALLAAGQALGDDDLAAYAVWVARGCGGRVATSGVVDAGLCHGSAGVAHVFNRVGQAAGDKEVLDLARYWAARAVDEPGPAAGGLLVGAAGTGLALLAAATAAEPFWDGPLLLRW